MPVIFYRFNVAFPKCLHFFVVLVVFRLCSIVHPFCVELLIFALSGISHTAVSLIIFK